MHFAADEGPMYVAGRASGSCSVWPGAPSSVQRDRLLHQRVELAEVGVHFLDRGLRSDQVLHVTAKPQRQRAGDVDLPPRRLVHDLVATHGLGIDVAKLDHAIAGTVVDHVHRGNLLRLPYGDGTVPIQVRPAPTADGQGATPGRRKPRAHRSISRPKTGAFVK